MTIHQVQLFKLGQSDQVFQTGVGYLRLLEAKTTQLCQLPELGEPFIGDLGARNSLAHSLNEPAIAVRRASSAEDHNKPYRNFLAMRVSRIRFRS